MYLLPINSELSIWNILIIRRYIVVPIKYRLCTFVPVMYLYCTFTNPYHVPIQNVLLNKTNPRYIANPYPIILTNTLANPYQHLTQYLLLSKPFWVTPTSIPYQYPTKSSGTPYSVLCNK